MDEDALRLTIVRLDEAVKDIYRIWSDVHSGYQYPKVYLAMSRAYVRSNPKKALHYAEKARGLFTKESVLATRYSIISEGKRTSSQSMIQIDREYLKAVSAGDYDRADAALRKMAAITGGVQSSGTGLEVERWASDENGVVILFRNTGDYLIAVNRLIVTAGSEVIETKPKAVFSVPPKSGREITVNSVSEVKIIAQYTECGVIKGIEKVL